MTCDQCGHRNDSQNRFCGGCGAPIEVQSSAERRHITVMFCDLVGSTQLSSQLDPEDLQELMRAYYRVCDSTVKNYDGHVAQYLGDGVLIYFGYPTAHEDDPVRAMQAGLDVVAGLQAEAQMMERRWGHSLSVRIGIHTGPVVVGEMGGSEQRQSLAMGETTNVAARLEKIAPQNSVVASQATIALSHRHFETTALEDLTLAGIPGPFLAHHVHRVRTGASRFDASGVTLPLVGRVAEHAALISAFEDARQGSGGTVLITGEPGIGKSRLLEELRAATLAGSEAGWLTLQCVAHKATHAFGPVVEALTHAMFDESETLTIDEFRTGLERLGDEVEKAVELLAQHFGLTVKRELTANWVSELRRRRTAEAFGKLLYACLGTDVGVLAIEDLHWADSSTLDLIADLGDRATETKRLLVLTARPEFSGAYDAPRGFVHLQLEGLNEEETGELIHHVAEGRKISPELVRMVANRSDGIPLFTEQVAQNLLELGEDLTRGPSTNAVPDTLLDLLNARLDRLGSSREVAQRLSVFGRSFPVSWVSLLCEDIAEINQKLEDLESADLLQRSGDMLRFKHALIQEAAYQTLLRRDRRRLHSRCAEAFQGGFASASPERPSLVAHHWSEAGNSEQAAAAWLEAGMHAMRRNAIEEAKIAMDRGLAVLDGIDDPKVRVDREIGLHFGLNHVLVARDGPASRSFRENSLRGLELDNEPNDPRNVYFHLAVSTSHLARGEFNDAAKLSQMALEAAFTIGNSTLSAVTHAQTARIAVYRGDLETIFEHTALAEEAWPSQGPHLGGPGMAALPVDTATFRALALWHSGSPDRALAESNRALELALAVAEPSGSEAYARIMGCWLLLLRGEPAQALESAEIGKEMAMEAGSSSNVSGFAQIIAWVACEMNPSATTARALELRSDDGFSQGGPMVAFDLALAGLTYGRAGQPDRGAALAEHAVELAESTGELYGYPEYLRACAELRLAAGGSEAEAIEGFSKALSAAEKLGMRSWALRSATDLARVRAGDSDARAILEPIYASFSEGLETRDLKVARTVLISLGQNG